MRSIYALAVVISLRVVAPSTPAFDDWDRGPSGHQPYVAHSPDGAWQLEVDPVAQERSSPTVLRLVHDGERAFEKREQGYPYEVCLSNDGTLLLTADHQHVRVLGTNGTEIARHAFDVLEAGDGRNLSITDWTYSPELDVFCIVFCASNFHGDVQVSLKPTIGALALVDPRRGVLTRPLDPWPPSGVPHTIVAVAGSRVLVVAYTRLGDKTVTRDQLLVLDGGELRGSIDSPVDYDRRRREWSLASGSPHEFTVQWPGETVVRHWKVTESSSGPSWREVGSEPVAVVPDSPSVSLRLARDVSLSLPADFVASRIVNEHPELGFAGLDDRGRIYLQDAATADVHVLDDEGKRLSTLHLADEEDAHPYVESVRSAEDGGFVVDSGRRLRTFDRDGRMLSSERKGTVHDIDVDGGTWVHAGPDIYLVRDGERTGATIERHSDRRFFTELGGLVRVGERIFLLDNTNWSGSDRIWRGRLSTYALGGKPLATRDIVLGPGERDLSILAAHGSWILLEGGTWIFPEGRRRRTSWLTRTDDESVQRLALAENGRTLGLSPDGKEVWRFDDEARVVHEYALPAR